MPSFKVILASIALFVGVAVYFFGIPKEWKQAMERRALKTMGENKASYMLKDQISKIPEADQQDVKDLKKGLNNITGGATNNRLGEEGGELADKLTSPFTGR
ncbi:hypothetical protein BT63DRAFT_474749 [Microthyrium microscopicum]|uniref:Uncharacterized protein n=1 Tax=Microthyrium microscopicum TaxID=703497 RepID=A0A6A6UVT3_9PEZI|nr:hypothetical protein BT63DRAFT_474749 [Microthyrium microscopicum]